MRQSMVLVTMFYIYQVVWQKTTKQANTNSSARMVPLCSTKTLNIVLFAGTNKIKDI